MFSSFLASIEFEACSRNLSYFNYLRLQSELAPDLPVISQEQYEALNSIIELFED